MKRPNRQRRRPEEIVAKPRRAGEALAKGVTVAEAARSLGVSEVTRHRQRAKYGAVDRDAVRRMKDLEKEHAPSKRLVADRQLDIRIPKEVAEGKSVRQARVGRRRRAIQHVTMVMAVSEPRTCRAVGQHRSKQRRPVPPKPYRDRPVARMRDLAMVNPHRGRRYIPHGTSTAASRGLDGQEPPDEASVAS